MTGTLINVAAILIGGTIGLFFGARIPEKFKNTVIAGMGLFTTALGLFAAIPAAVAYNYFSHQLREMGSRMDDFSLEFLNLTERSYGE